MPAKTPDRRTARTRTALMSAFVELMLTRGFPDVSVEDIVVRADVGRSTFYLHFRSKDDILKQSLTRPSGGLAALVGQGVTAAALTALLEHFHSQRKLNRVFFAYPARAVWIRCLAELIEPRLTALLRAHCGSRSILPLPMIAAQIAESQIALIANWLMSRNAAKADTVAEALVAMTRANVEALLRQHTGSMATPA
ncbi:MAG: TetR/AcrR family transcriptional regulator [Rhizomicrobium sp.]